MMQAADIRNICIGSFFLLITGLLLPCMTVYPSAGEFTGWVQIFAPEILRPTTYSIIGGIGAMFDNGSYFIGILLFVFSVIFPVWKMSTFIYYLLRKSRSPSRSLKLALVLGKYSMLDVFVLAVIVICVKGLPGGSRVELEAGIVFFSASVILSLACGSLISKLPAESK